MKESPCATHNVGVITTVISTTGGEDADVIVPAATVATGHGVTRVLTRVVLHVMMIATTAAVGAIRTVDVTMIADMTTTVDATRAAGVTAEGIAADTATLTPWTKAVTDPDPAHVTGTIARHPDLTRTPGTPGRRSGRSDDANIADYDVEDGPYVN